MLQRSYGDKTSTVFVRLVWPRVIRRCVLGTSHALLKSSRSMSFAFPSAGGAVSRTLNVPSELDMTSLRAARAITFTRYCCPIGRFGYFFSFSSSLMIRSLSHSTTFLFWSVVIIVSRTSGRFKVSIVSVLSLYISVMV